MWHKDEGLLNLTLFNDLPSDLKYMDKKENSQKYYIYKYLFKKL